MKTLNNSEGQGSFPFQNAYPILNYFTNTLNLDKESKMEQKLGTIYIATNLVNGKQNVGQTTRGLKQRMKEHQRKEDSPLLYQAIKKYGKENFKIISFSCSEEDLDWTETFLIAELNTQKPNGYNLESGGHKNKHHHELSKQKMSECKSGQNNPMWGKHHTEETRQKMSGENHHLWGRNHTEETRKLLSENHADVSSKNNPMWGKHHTEETRQKMSENHADVSGENHPMWSKHHSEETKQKLKESALLVWYKRKFGLK